MRLLKSLSEPFSAFGMLVLVGLVALCTLQLL